MLYAASGEELNPKLIKSLSIMGLSPYYTPELRKVAKNYPSDFISLA
jgi:hypothetical protein